MHKKTKSIGLMTSTRSTCDFIKQQLMKFLEPNTDIKVQTWCLDDSSTPPAHFQDCDIYLVSTPSVYQNCKNYLPADKKVIMSRRTVNPENLYRILNIVAGEKVLVVTTVKETADNTIDILRRLGIWHIDFESWWPRCQKPVADNIRIAITPGLPGLVPQNIKEIVNIGGKGVDISTLCEILLFFDLPLSILDNFSSYYLKAILRNSIQIRDSALQNEKINNNLKIILGNVMEGIIAIDRQNKIRFCNPTAHGFLANPGRPLLDRDIREAIPGFEALLRKTASGLEKNCVVSFNNKQYTVKRYSLDGHIMGADDLTVIALLPADELIELNQRMRHTLKNKGNVAKYNFKDIVGQSPGIAQAVALAKSFAATDLTMLIEGESGTGKELLAHSIHNMSKRRNESFVAVNFASMPETLAESILFGYMEGAFTGAKRGGNAGLFEEAHLGTIFLDELGSATPETQNHLLRVLEEAEIRRIGGTAVIPVNIRVIVASNKPLEELVNQGLFRKDLFYRVCAAPVYLVPLRERDGDVELLFHHFAKVFYKRDLSLAKDLTGFLYNYQWPGNVRELYNVVRYICHVAEKNNATLADLPAYLLKKLKHQPPAAAGSLRAEDAHAELMAFAASSDKTAVMFNILNILWEAKILQKSIGRQYLQKEMARRGIILSDHKIKYWLQVATQLGYTIVGTTRQGSFISDKGKQALDFLANRRTGAR